MRQITEDEFFSMTSKKNNQFYLKILELGVGGCLFLENSEINNLSSLRGKLYSEEGKKYSLKQTKNKEGYAVMRIA